jgi:ubiquinone/menaquinone biosynthesis C-methylase UbiE
MQTFNEKTFADYEREGWERNAPDYDEIDLPVTRQAIAPLLDSVAELQGRHLLEVASGTGHLAQAAVVRGAKVVGIDVAKPMVDLARRRAKDAVFHKGAAEALPVEDASFDVVLCSFGLLHFAEPEQAIREAARVLKTGGTYAFTVWHAPDRGSDFFRILLSAYQEYANMEIGLPPAPPMFALADPAIRTPILQDAGFGEIQVRDLAIEWPLRGPETAFEFTLKGAVRTRLIYERQTPEVQQKIRQAMIIKVMPYIEEGRTGIPCPAVLVTAQKVLS